LSSEYPAACGGDPLFVLKTDKTEENLLLQETGG